MNSVIKEDTIIKDVRGFAIARPGGAIFKKIIEKIRIELNDLIFNVTQKINKKLVVSNFDGFVGALVSDILKSFDANSLVCREYVDYKGNEVSKYRDLKKLLHGDDLGRVHKIMREGVNLRHLLIGYTDERQEQKIYDNYAAEYANLIDFDKSELELLLNAAIYRMFISLILDGSESEYIFAKNILIMQLVYLMADTGKLELWGRIFIQYDVKDSLV